MFDFPETVADLTAVPDIYHGLYQPVEVGFALDPALAEKLDVSGLVSALEKERGANRTLEKELDGWRQLGPTPEEAWQQKSDALNAELSELFEAVLTEKDAEITRLKASNTEFLITSRATEALLAAGALPELLMPHIRAAIMVVEEAGEPALRVAGPDGTLREKSDGVPMTVADLVSEMRASAVFARAFDPTGNRGSGMDPAGVPVRLSAINGHNQWAVNARIEDIATGKVAVSL
ncbi:hypothetical protein [Sneathiella sp.]|uniref:hypothetical protein n=1 Tax=Sneathiella sp. TaxID=1964365 RepID=UPI003565A492